MSRSHHHQPAFGWEIPPSSFWGHFFQWLSGRNRAGGASGKFPLTQERIAFLLPQLPGWRVVERNRIPRLERVYRFPDLAGALAFAVQVSALGDVHAHQPALHVEHDRVTVSWWTLSMGGLLREDFNLAARTDALYQPG